MNITLNIPAASFERLLSAIERIANAADRFCPPTMEYKAPEPFAPEYWGTSSNAQSIQIEEEDRWAAKGYGPDYQNKLIADANRIRDLANASGQESVKDPS